MTTSILEVGEINRATRCSHCAADLREVVGALSLLCCEKCHRHVLKRNVVEHVSTMITVRHGTDIVDYRSCRFVRSITDRQWKRVPFCQRSSISQTARCDSSCIRYGGHRIVHGIADVW